MRARGPSLPSRWSPEVREADALALAAGDMTAAALFSASHSTGGVCCWYARGTAPIVTSSKRQGVIVSAKRPINFAPPEAPARERSERAKACGNQAR
jgi:hypothetical protein